MIFQTTAYIFDNSSTAYNLFPVPPSPCRPTWFLVVRSLPNPACLSACLPASESWLPLSSLSSSSSPSFWCGSTFLRGPTGPRAPWMLPDRLVVAPLRSAWTSTSALPQVRHETCTFHQSFFQRQSLLFSDFSRRKCRTPKAS